MEDLWLNRRAAFTRWVVRQRYLETPFVLIDVGVQGDVHERWEILGDLLVVHGFDAISEVIDQLQQRNRGQDNRQYHQYAIGDRDGEATFYFNAVNPTSSSMYAQGASRFKRELSEEQRTVQMRRLDTLMADGVIPPADFLKVDVEGFERSVLMGARTLLTSGILAVETETNLGVSPTYPKGHLFALSEILVEHSLIVFDLAFNRIPRLAFAQALAAKGDTSSPELGKPATLNVLFSRDAIDESDSPHHYITAPSALSVDKIIKLMIVYELYGLNDIAVDSAVRFRELLRHRFDVEAAISLLADANCRTDASGMIAATSGSLSDRSAAARLASVSAQLNAMEHSLSWRLTAPLRAAKQAIRTGLSRPDKD
jgi:FkbM family methyltransferase